MPTWNYVAVHAYGRVEVIEDEGGLLSLLVQRRRQGLPLVQPWQTARCRACAVIQHPLNEVHVLHADGVPAELDRRNNDDIELVQFGLMPEFIGEGLGKCFLQWTIDKAWSYQPKQFWFHTCTLDHPVALANYLESGFVLYKEEMVQRDIVLAKSP